MLRVSAQLHSTISPDFVRRIHVGRSCYLSGRPHRGSTPELPRRHQGRRHRRRRCQRHQPDDRGRPQGRRVHRGQHRRAGAADERRRRQARRGPRAHPRPRGGRRPRGRQARRRGPRGGDRGGPQGGRHGLRHRGRGWWHRHRWRPRRRPHREGPGRPDHRRGHPTVHLRGAPPRQPGRDRHRAAARGGRHAHRHPQRPAAVDQRPRRLDARRLPQRRPGAALGCAGHHRPDHHTGPDQPRLRRRQVGHVGGRAPR